MTTLPDIFTSAFAPILVIADERMPRDTMAFVEPGRLVNVEFTPTGFAFVFEPPRVLQVVNIVKYDSDDDCYASGDDY